MSRVAIVLLALVSVALAFPAEEKKPIRILKQSVSEPQPDGSYKYSYETENGINVEENAISNPDLKLKLVSGSFSYTAPDGTPIQLIYTANEEGFEPAGDHLPVPPPIPKQIQRALDYIATHPEENEEYQ